MTPLPEFKELVVMAKQDPEAFERFRQSACEQFIATVPCTHQPRLAAIQNRVEMELRCAKTPMAGLLKISCMMHDSLYQLSSQWIAFNRTTLRSTQTPLMQSSVSAAVIDLREWKDRRKLKIASLD